MIELISVMWTVAFFFGFLGFLRGWNRSLTGTAGILLAAFGIFQFDALLRSSVYLLLTPATVFLAQSAVFIVVVVLSYQAELEDDEFTFQDRLIGVLVGFVNGYLVGGTIWYFLDINRYPFSQFVTAPAANSPSADGIGWMPIVLINGGTNATGDLLALLVVGLLFLVLVVF
jgi:uncharacterized membrane protein required for colicin V production